MYLGKKFTKDGTLHLEFKIRIEFGWTAFGKVYHIVRSSKSTTETKRNLFNEYILLVMIYGSEMYAEHQTIKTVSIDGLFTSLVSEKTGWLLGRPTARRRDDLIRYLSPKWSSMAKGRK